MEINSQELDAALILEDKLKERVARIVERVVVNIVGREIHAAIDREKQAMITEITLSIGKALQSIEKDGRVPLWESNPYVTDIPDFIPVNADGEPIPTVEINYALQEQSRPQI
jgi:hypothetical protein